MLIGHPLMTVSWKGSHRKENLERLHADWDIPFLYINLNALHMHNVCLRVSTIRMTYNSDHQTRRLLCIHSWAKYRLPLCDKVPREKFSISWTELLGQPVLPRVWPNIRNSSRKSIPMDLTLGQIRFPCFYLTNISKYYWQLTNLII